VGYGRRQGGRTVKARISDWKRCPVSPFFQRRESKLDVTYVIVKLRELQNNAKVIVLGSAVFVLTIAIWSIPRKLEENRNTAAYLYHEGTTLPTIADFIQEQLDVGRVLFSNTPVLTTPSNYWAQSSGVLIESDIVGGSDPSLLGTFIVRPFHDDPTKDPKSVEIILKFNDRYRPSFYFPEWRLLYEEAKTKKSFRTTWKGLDITTNKTQDQIEVILRGTWPFMYFHKPWNHRSSDHDSLSQDPMMVRKAVNIVAGALDGSPAYDFQRGWDEGWVVLRDGTCISVRASVDGDKVKVHIAPFHNLSEKLCAKIISQVTKMPEVTDAIATIGEFTFPKDLDLLKSLKVMH